MSSTLCLGVIFTLPWSISCAPEIPTFDSGTLWWIAFGKGQALAYAVGYGLLSLSIFTCLLIVVATRRDKEKLEHASVQASGCAAHGVDASSFCDGSDQRPPMGSTPHDTSSAAPASTETPAELEPSHHLRLCIIFVCAMIRFAGQSGTCARLAFGGSFVDGGTLTELLLLLVTLEDGQGLLCLILFGLQPHNLRNIFGKLEGCGRGCSSAAVSQSTQQRAVEQVISIYSREWRDREVETPPPPPLSLPSPLLAVDVMDVRRDVRD